MTPPHRQSVCMSFLLAAALCVQMSCSSGFTDGELPYRVHHSPYLQLGDAPLVGFAGSETDQVEILWQTAGVPDSHCRFTVAYRPAGAASWTSAGDPQSIDTGVDSRVVHFVRLAGLDYAADYEYRVQHLRDDRLLNTWQSTFRTRLASSDDTPFSFVAYGDSATRAALTPFRNVHSRINRIDTDLVILLGDNAYEDGSHADLDARFDPRLSPEATKWNAGHIDYFAIGNHDVRTESQRARDVAVEDEEEDHGEREDVARRRQRPRVTASRRTSGAQLLVRLRMRTLRHVRQQSPPRRSPP